MSIIFITILILFLIKLFHDSLSLMRLWQVKMYRIDRMMSHLKEDKNIFQNNLFYISVIVIVVLYFIFLKNSLLMFQYVVLVLFVISFFQIINEIKKRIFNRPKPTLKIVLIFSVMTIFYILLFAIYWISASAGMTKIENNEIIEYLLVIYLITPALFTIIILLVNPFFDFQKKRLIKKATVKMRMLKKIKVIGITGSYGKTSTKEFLYMILSQKYKVIKTEGNNNTNIGVAYAVLNKLSDGFDYFICEMGAYKLGDIAEICDIVKPEIGILTGINEQHLELFGSIENTKKTKFELIEALPESGIAIINSSIKYQASNIKVRDIKYFSKENTGDIKYNSNQVEFKYKNQIFKTRILGKHYIENIISAIIVAEHLGMSLDEIAKGVEKIESTEYMMKKLDGSNNSVFIDDSYSANPDGVLAALEYLNEAYADYKKIIVFPGIIELGKTDDEVHRKLFDRIGEVCDVAYVVSQKSIKLKIHKVNENNCKFVFEKDFDKVAEMVKNELNENTVVLFENRGAGVVMGKIKKRSNQDD